VGLWAYGPVNLWVVGFEHNIYHVCSTKCGPVDCGLVDLWICGAVELWVVDDMSILYAIRSVDLWAVKRMPIISVVGGVDLRKLCS